VTFEQHADTLTSSSTGSDHSVLAVLSDESETKVKKNVKTQNGTKRLMRINSVPTNYFPAKTFRSGTVCEKLTSPINAFFNH
jgi:hypothetical protein